MTLHSLDELGFGPDFREALARLDDDTLQPARVAAEHRGAYEVLTTEGQFRSTIVGRVRHEAVSRLDLPAVGDWVAWRADGAVITHVLERRTALVRGAAGERTEPQVVAANVDTVWVVTAADNDFNPRRIERYLALVRQAGAEPAIVPNKCDLIDDPWSLIEQLGPIASSVPVATVSAEQHDGLDKLQRFLLPGHTIALVGSSGVGKSTLAGWLLGAELATTPVREGDDKGRHTTTRRELLPIEAGLGGLLIDTPGLREIAVWDAAEGIDATFDDVASVAEGCRFGDCQHADEPGCAVIEAIEGGSLSAERFESWQKLRREQAYLRRRSDARLDAEAQRKWRLMARDALEAKRLLTGR